MWEINPNPGKIKIYTSGCPKNQNKCWYKIGSPPPEGSKKEVFKFRSVNNIVIAPAKTGNESNNKKAVIKTAHTNRGSRSIYIPVSYTHLDVYKRQSNNINYIYFSNNLFLTCGFV